jgi:hypothetical protein
MAAMDRVAEAGDWGDFTINLEIGRWDPILALAGYLRAAYLALFAKLGYRYAFSPELEPVRRHLAAPKSTPLTGFSFINREADGTEKRIWSVEYNDDQTAFAVQMGHRLVLLPSRHGDLDFYTRLGAVPDGTRFDTTRVLAIAEWPTRPEHQADVR